MPRCGKFARSAAWLLLACLAAACGDDTPDAGGVGEQLVLVATPPSLMLPPGALGKITFSLQDQNSRPQPGRTLRIDLLLAERSDAGPEPTSGGATLLTSEGTTDDRGRFVAKFHAGTAGALRLRASHLRGGSLVVPVTVAKGASGLAEAQALVQTGLNPATIEFRLFPSQACSQLRANTPALTDPTLSQALPVQARWTLPPLATEQSFALTARGVDQLGVLVGFGCINIDGRSLLQTTPVALLVPLTRISPNLGARYLLASELAFTPEMAPGAVTLATAWGRFSGCSNDPASVWLDCTLDALGAPDDPEDPLDCRPSPDEGDLGQLLAARLGSAVAAGSDCRGDRDVGGQPSFDLSVRELFPAAASPVVAVLPALAADAAGLFRRIRVSSSLEFVFSGRPRIWQALHALSSLGFPVGDTFYSVNVLDRPGRLARFITATVDAADQRVDLASHGFGVRLGRVAREAFLARALQQRGLPPDETTFVNVLFRTATLPRQNDDPLTGCAALDARLCADLGRASGCLLAACETGLQTLVARLRAGFDQLDGDDLDLFLQGGAVLADRKDDGSVGGLGSLLANRVGPGLWTGELRSLAGSTSMTGLWVGTRPPGQ